jgi:uncharacterized protein YceK
MLGCMLALTGCGSTARTNPPTHASTPAQARVQQMKTVVHEWSTRLNAGNDAAVAQLFRVPVLMTQGAYVFRLVSKSQVARWHAALPCAGHVVSITVRGRIATAVFRLGDRTTTRCDAPGTLAAARFTIVRGKIVAWQQIPVPPKKAAPVA